MIHAGESPTSGVSVTLFSAAAITGIIGGILYLFDAPAVPAKRPAQTAAPTAAFEF